MAMPTLLELCDIATLSGVTVTILRLGRTFPGD
jgi:hypothetical protein